VTYVLVISTTVGMLYRVHRDTTDLGPVVTFHTEFVEVVTSLEHGLISTPTSGNNSHHASTRRQHRFLVPTREPDSTLASIIGVTDNDARGTAGSGQGPTVPDLFLHHTDHRTLGALVQWDNVADGEVRARAGVDKLARVGSLDGGHELFTDSVTVRISEGDARQWGSTTRVMDDFLNKPFYVPVTFNVVLCSEPGGAFSVLGTGFKDASSTFTLPANDTTHIHTITP